MRSTMSGSKNARRSPLVALSLSFLFTACATPPKLPAPNASRFSPQDLLISPSTPLPPVPSQLTAAEVKTDVEFLTYAIDRGYGGRDFLPKGEIEKLFRRLHAISGPLSSADFHERIDTALIEVSDSHLLARLNGARSKPRNDREKLGQVGKNVYRKTADSPWFVELRKSGSRSVLLVSIVSFPAHESELWQGFLERVERLLPRADAAILDFRGNRGGDDTMGLALAWLFHARDFRDPLASQYERRTPETRALVVNSSSFSLAFKKMTGERAEPYLETRYKSQLESYQQALDARATGYAKEKLGLIATEHRPQRPLAPFKNPIYILMDAECASSCESTIDGFEFHPMTKKIGERTAGFVHFGNVSPVLLPKSRILVQVPTHYSEYGDGRFIEKTGLVPDIALAKGEDALEVALKLLTIARPDTRP